LLTYGLSFSPVQTLLELGRAYLRWTTSPGSGRPWGRPATSFASDPTSATCPPRSRTCSRLGSRPGQRRRASSLTPAELRLLLLMSTHLTFREIGGRLYISEHTVKSEAVSIYRKLRVSSGGQAVERIWELGPL
jgi:LuxR family transcriptional regulator, maltose regulon positive regulatory protein